MKTRPILFVSLAAGSLLLGACGQDSAPLPPQAGADEAGFTAPTAHTAKANAQVAEQLPINDEQDFIDAKRGLIARDENLSAQNADGKTVWDQNAYSFIDGPAPASANPSLWRQAKLNNIHGVFEVNPGLYQLRGFDLANMSVIEGEKGLILVDPFTTKETAAKAWAFARQHLPQKPISAIIFTHSHIDHFGGVTGIISAEEVRQQNIAVIAPAHFMEEAVSENVMAGLTMQRRAGFMYGRDLPRSPRGHIDTGLGKEPPQDGTIGILEPTYLVDHSGQKSTVDGVDFVFQYAPESEAPAELTFYLPQHKAWCGAELVSRNLHNVYTLRGAKVRNALRWSRYIEEARVMFAEADIYFASHHWPIWGQAAIQDFLSKQRDIYKFIHDQSLRLANMGYTSREIAEEIQLPEALSRSFPIRGYYGTVKHNAKAVYQGYFGWYDGNPANLDPLPPVEAGQRYVELAGGAEALIAQAQKAFDTGDYRWSAELLNHLVFADDDNTAAKQLLAASYDQLGYQAESGPWRDVYLSAAYELRHGRTKTAIKPSSAIDLLREVPLPMFLDAMGARLNPEKAAGKNIKLKINFSDRNEAYVLQMANSVIHHQPAGAQDEVDATLNLTHELFLKISTDTADLADTLLSGDLQLEGSKLKLLSFFSTLDKPDGLFNIVTP